VEQIATPSAFNIWKPNNQKEEFLVMATDHYKFKLLNANTKVCKKTILAPTYGSPLTKYFSREKIYFHIPTDLITESSFYRFQTRSNTSLIQLASE
jgi:hypothetical protein